MCRIFLVFAPPEGLQVSPTTPSVRPSEAPGSLKNMQLAIKQHMNTFSTLCRFARAAPNAASRALFQGSSYVILSCTGCTGCTCLVFVHTGGSKVISPTFAPHLTAAAPLTSRGRWQSDECCRGSPHQASYGTSQIIFTTAPPSG